MRKYLYSEGCGSLTFNIISDLSQSSAGLSMIIAPTDIKSWSVKPLSSPAADSTYTSCPACLSICTPAGVIATLFSLFLISFGTPILILRLPLFLLFIIYLFAYFEKFNYHFFDNYCKFPEKLIDDQVFETHVPAQSDLQSPQANPH